MRALFRADLDALRNALRLREGRKVLAGDVVGYLFVVLVGVLVGGRLVVARPVLQALREAPEAVGPPLLALVAMGSTLLALGVALNDVRTLLFGGARTELLLGAPIPRASIVVHAWLRALLSTVLAATALALPSLIRIADATPAGASLPVGFVLVALLLSAPATAALVLALVLARLLLSNPRARVAWNLLGGLAGFGAVLALGASLVASKSQQRGFARALEEAGELPFAIDAPGRALAAAAGFAPGGGALGALALFACASIPLVAAAALLHRAAFEASFALRDRPRSRAPRARRWPRSVARSVLRKDLAITLQTKSSFAGFAFLGAFALVFLASELFDGARVRHEAAPRAVSDFLGLASTWQVLLMLIATLQGGTFLADELPQRDLLAASPASRGALLRGKLPAILLPYAWLLLVVAAAAPLVRGIGAGALGAFLAYAAASAALTLGIVLALGTLPELNRPRAHLAKVLLLALAVGAPSVGLLVALHRVRMQLAREYAAGGGLESALPLLLAGAAALALAGTLVAALGWRAARRNVERLLEPEA